MEHQQGGQISNRNHHHHHHHPYNGGGGREDCWTEGATAILIEAWGDRYLALSRGNLRQKDWKDVADAVNGRSDGVKPRRTDIQCKNRIDTIKKKYKLEKSKPGPSQWPFYSRLDHLIGTTTPPANRKTTTTPHPRPPPPPPSPLPLSLTLPSYVHKSPAVTFTVKQGKGKMYNHNPNPNAGVYSGGSSSKSRLNSSDSTESSGGAGGDEDDDDNAEDDDDEVFNNGTARKHQHRMGRDSSDGTPFRELAKAVLKFGEIYERIENSKQQQMMELERQKMEFTKDLEFQRMQMFMEAQLELEKMKRPRNASTTGKKL